VKECALFISSYRNKHGHYPSFNNLNKTEHQISIGKQKKRNVEIKEDILIVQESSEELIKKCLLSNLGLIMIHNFNYEFLNNSRTEIRFSAQEINLGDTELKYSIQELNEMLNY
jgi:hypothetical protein